MDRRLVWRLVAAAGLGFIAASAATMGHRLWKSKALVRASFPFERTPAGVITPTPRRLLVVGDSTAEGTGASLPQNSLVGRIGAAHPRLAIVNRGRDGALFEAVPAQIAAGDPGERFDAVLVLAGGNDTLQLTAMDKLREDVAATIAAARSRADLVVLMPAGNLGNAPFFFPPWSWWATQRSRRVHAVVRELAAASGVEYVKLFEERADDPFAHDAGLSAEDGLHPSDAGYARWWKSLEAQSSLSARLR